jgi:hypothetical protein
MLQIIGTNEVTHKVSRFNPGTGRSELITTVLTDSLIDEELTKLEAK